MTKQVMSDDDMSINLDGCLLTFIYLFQQHSRETRDGALQLVNEIRLLIRTKIPLPPPPTRIYI